MRRTLAVLAGVLTFVLWIPPFVSAGPLSVYYLLQNDAATPPSLSGSGLGTDSLAPITLSGTEGATTGTTTAQANHGSLDLYGAADGQVLIVSGIQFTDTLTLVSATLAPGTLVDLAFSFDLDYSLTSTCVRDAARVGAYVSLGANDLQFTDDSCSGIGLNNTAGVATFAIGDTIDFNVQLQITAGAGNCCELGFAEADALIRFFVNPLGRDFTYISLTGDTYMRPADATAVPEPASLLLLGAGIAGIAARLRSRTREDH